MIISFGWTTPALIAGAKTVTRRDWTPGHAAHFKAGMLVDAWNTSPRNVKGNPHKVAVIRLTTTVEREYVRDAPQGDYEAEGMEYLTSIGATLDGLTPTVFWARWLCDNPDLYVVRFEVVEYMEGLLA
jgi:hypothetical protein